MKPTSMTWLPLVATCVLACCTVGNAQTKSTASQVGDQAKGQSAPVKAAQKSGKPVESKQKVAPTKQANEKTPQVTPKRRVELMTFLKKHHPQLRPLLGSLKKNRPEQFESALRTLDVEIKKLQALKQRSPSRYKKSLELWIVKSKIKLVTAQLVTKKKEEDLRQLKKDLQALINEQYDLRVAHLADDVAVAKKRHQKLQVQLTDLKANRNDKVQQQMMLHTIKNAQQILAAQKKKAADARKKQAKPAKPAGTAPRKKTKQQDDNPNPSDD